MHSTFRGSKYLLSDRGGKFTVKQFAWLAEELGFIKVYTLPHIPIDHSVTECAHSFL